MAHVGRTVLQIPMDRALRVSAEQAAIKEGFTSLQEVVRLFLHRFRDRTIRFQYTEAKPVQLSKKTAERYDKILSNMKKGHGRHTAHSLEELMTKLDT